MQAEWGYVYAGEVLVSAVDEEGRYQVDKLEVGDIWYFPKGSAHTVQGKKSFLVRIRSEIDLISRPCR